MKIERYANNPILAPIPTSDWESVSVCNPGVWHDGDKFYLLYRAGPDTDLHPVYLGLAESEDGLHFTRVSDRPVFGPSENGFDGGCIEDPRIIRFGDTYFVTYAARMFPPGAYWKQLPLNGNNPDMPPEAPFAVRYNITRSALAATKDFKTWHRLGPITPPNVDDRDAIIFPEKVGDQFVMLHRPGPWVGPEYGCEKPSIWISFSDDLLTWEHSEVLASPMFDWEAHKIGGNAPPIKTEKGWLLLHHGVNESMSYRVGAMLLDLDNPRKVLARTPEPVMEPTERYECEGIVKNVVFPCGTVVKDGILYIYYGGADTCCCAATVPLKEFIDFVAAYPVNAS